MCLYCFLEPNWFSGKNEDFLKNSYNQFLTHFTNTSDKQKNKQKIVFSFVKNDLYKLWKLKYL